jgi:hypothetical protein
VKRYRLTVAVNQENGSRRAFHTEPRQDGFYSMKLLFVNYKGRFCHFGFLF